MKSYIQIFVSKTVQSKEIPPAVSSHYTWTHHDNQREQHDLLVVPGRVSWADGSPSSAQTCPTDCAGLPSAQPRPQLLNAAACSYALPEQTGVGSVQQDREGRKGRERKRERKRERWRKSGGNHGCPTSANHNYKETTLLRKYIWMNVLIHSTD